MPISEVLAMDGRLLTQAHALADLDDEAAEREAAWRRATGGQHGG